MKNILFTLLVLLFLQGCSDVWLGENQEEIILEGKRIDVIPSSSFSIDNEELLNNDIDLAKPVSIRNIKTKWETGSFKDSDFGLLSSPVVADGKVYIFDNIGKVSCIDKHTGRKQWSVLVSQKRENLSGIFGGGLIVGKNTLFVSTGFGDVFSLDKVNGGMVWRYSSIAPFNSAPYLYQNVVLINNRENETLALEASTGKLLWKKIATPENASILSNLQITGNSRMIFSEYTSGELFALVPNTGKEVWSDTLNIFYKTDVINTISDIVASPVLANDIIITNGLDNQIIAIDIQTGNRIWQKKIKLANTPVVIGKYIYLLTQDNKLIAMSTVNGGVYWIKDLSDLYSKDKIVKWSGLSIYKNNIIINNNQKDIYLFSAKTGKITFNKHIRSFSIASPVINDDCLYILESTGNVKAFYLLH
jgi:outer membrane protein assembly factor BamB